MRYSTALRSDLGWLAAAVICFSGPAQALEAPPVTGDAALVAAHLERMQPLAAPFLTGALNLVYQEDEAELDKLSRLHWQHGQFRQDRDWLNLPETYSFDGTDYWYGSVEMLPVRLDHTEPADVTQQQAACLWYCAPSQQQYLRPLTGHELAEAAQLPQLHDKCVLAWTPPQMSEAWLLLEPASLELQGCLYGDQRELDKSGVIKLSLFGEWTGFTAARYPATVQMLTIMSDGTEVRRRDARVLSIEGAAEREPAWFSMASAPVVPRPVLPGGRLVLPFTLRDDDITLTAGGPDHSPLILKFDSGANIGLLRRDVAARLGWQAQGAVPVSGHGGSADMEFLRASGITLGGIELPAYTCGVMPQEAGPQPGEQGYAYHQARLQSHEHSLDRMLREDGVDGLLGTVLLNCFAVRIDYSHLTLTLYESEGFDARHELGAAALELPLHRDALPYTEVIVDGRLSGGAFFNTGARPYFNLALWALDAHGIEYPIESIATGMSIHGMQVFGIVRPGIVELGGLKLQKPYTFLESLAPGDEPDPARVASFGSEFFHDHAVTFDLAHERVYLEPQPGG